MIPVRAGGIAMPGRPPAVLDDIATARLGGTLVRSRGRIVGRCGLQIAFPGTPIRLPGLLTRPLSGLPRLCRGPLTRTHICRFVQLPAPLLELPHPRRRFLGSVGSSLIGAVGIAHDLRMTPFTSHARHAADMPV